MDRLNKKTASIAALLVLLIIFVAFDHDFTRHLCVAIAFAILMYEGKASGLMAIAALFVASCSPAASQPGPKPSMPKQQYEFTKVRRITSTGDGPVYGSFIRITFNSNFVECNYSGDHSPDMYHVERIETPSDGVTWIHTMEGAQFALLKFPDRTELLTIQRTGEARWTN